jgi:predicted metalloprotease
VRRRVLVAAAAAVLLAACAPDPGVSTLEAEPVPAPPATTPTTAPTTTPTTPAPTTPTTTPVTPTPSGPSDGPLPTLPADPPATPTTLEPTGSTLPPIVEPELYTEVPLADVVDVGADKPPRRHDTLLAVALVDIDAWLAEQLPDAFGIEWQPLEGGIWAGYPERTDDVPGCGEQTTEYDDLTLYAAFYCEFGDFMAYDDGEDGIIVALADELGASVLGVVLAHEYGHAVQQRSGALAQGYPTVLTEQQADCVSGAWVGRVYRGESPLLRLGDRDLRAGLVAMVEVRDPVGVDQFEVGGHGTAFDRVGAFQLGFAEGLASCAPLLDDPMPLMPNVFQSPLDFERGGDAPYDCADEPPALQPDCVAAPDFMEQDLNHYWQTIDAEFPTLNAVPVQDFATFTCPDEVAITDTVSYCPRDGGIAYDEPRVLELYADLGDFTLGYFYGVAWAEVQQIRTSSDLTGERRALRNDCWTGAWVRDITPDASGQTGRSGDSDGDGEPDSTVVTSPGDLDEAVNMAIILGDLGSNVDRVGSPFEKIASFRAGVLGGIDACP